MKSKKNILLLSETLFLLFFSSTSIIGGLLYTYNDIVHFSFEIKMFLSNFLHIIAIIFSILVTNKYFLEINTNHIYSNKKKIIIFFSWIIIHINLMITYSLGIFINENILLPIFIFIMITAVIISGDFRQYNFNRPIKEIPFIIIITIIIAISLIVPRYFLLKDIILSKPSIRYTFLVFFYPAMYEEILFRNFSISTLKTFCINPIYINIIQSIIFGLTHITLYKEFGWWSLIMISPQILAGFLYGYVYLKGKSLATCILLHGLFNLIGASISYI